MTRSAVVKTGHQRTGARLRFVLAPGVALGPGKADLLEGIRDTGSIAAAGRRMGMSYKRAWLLVEELNQYFRTPLVETMRGGTDRGGATLTAAGIKVLDCYRRMEKSARAATARDARRLQRMLTDISNES